MILQAISTEECDRANDSMVLAGAKLENFLKNPVVQWAHDGSIPAVGVSRSIEIVNGEMQSQTEFHGATELSAQLYTLYEGGYLTATSVGFIPLSWIDLDATVMAPIYPWCDKVRRYDTWELLEYSCCNVPMNPGAVGAGDGKSMLAGIRKALDEGAISGTSGVLPLLIAEYMTDADARMKQMFDAVMAKKITVTQDTNTTTQMATTPTQKALDQATAEDLMNQIIPAVKTAIQTILTKGNYDFTTTDLQTIASDCAEDVIEMLSGTSDEGTEPAGTTAPADPNAAPEAPAEAAIKEAPTFTDEAGALSAFLPIHEQELAIAQAALALQGIGEDAKDFFTMIAEDTPGEIEECQSLIDTLAAGTETQVAESGKMFVVKAGAKHSKATLKSLTTALTHAKNTSKELKAIIRAGTADPNAEAPAEPAKARKRYTAGELAALYAEQASA